MLLQAKVMSSGVTMGCAGYAMHNGPQVVKGPRPWHPEVSVFLIEGGSIGAYHRSSAQEPLQTLLHHWLCPIVV